MKGYTIDCKYLVKVSDLMYPRPTRRLTDVDGTRLELITVECEV